jgi:hypothetical protein
MKKFAVLSSVLLVLVALTACGQTEADKQSALRSFFESHHKSGASPDYGIFKRGDDYVVSVHGFGDNLGICLKLAAKLNQQEPGAYECEPLNH